MKLQQEAQKREPARLVFAGRQCQEMTRALPAQHAGDVTLTRKHPCEWTADVSSFNNERAEAG